MEDIVITSYKQQIRESEFKADAVKSAGFDIVVEELKNRGVKTERLEKFFEQIVEAVTVEDLNKLTMDEFSEIVDDINKQVTRALIAKAEIADSLVRKSKLVALSKSIDGKVDDNDNYVKVGSNLALEINKEGIAAGIDVCIRNYCNQKIYQANYREKMIEKQKENGTYVENEDKDLIHQQLDGLDSEDEKIDFSKFGDKDLKKELLQQIFKKEVEVETEIDFETAKENYRNMINERMAKLEDLK